ncbi:MAG: hypothetical protein WHS43_00325 [Aquificaceae bacterium]|uniref:hypothetical protein n=1 Tax=Hydrogenobacter sp. Uz 6-8 TaxID=3384828 RepID=UPI0030A5FC36
MFECLLLQAEGLFNSAIFASDGHVLTGRVFSEGEGYQALLLDERRRIAFLIGDKRDESLYSVKKCGGNYVAAGHSGERSLLLIYNSTSGVISSFLGPEGILWQVSCEYAVGGLRENLWRLFIVEVAKRRGRAYSADNNIYAYSLAGTGGGYVVVGRVGEEGKYDGFILWTDPYMKPLKAIRSGWKENDYLRYTNGRWAAGRMEIGGDSEGFLVKLAGLESILYKRPGFDYFRFVSSDGLFIAGEGDGQNQVRKALLVHNRHGSLLGEGFSAVRFYDERSMNAYGYVYKEWRAYAFRLRHSHVESGFNYLTEHKPLKWKSLKLSAKRGSLELREQNFPVSEVAYTWEECGKLP